MILRRTIRGADECARSVYREVSHVRSQVTSSIYTRRLSLTHTHIYTYAMADLRAHAGSSMSSFRTRPASDLCSPSRLAGSPVALRSPDTTFLPYLSIYEARFLLEDAFFSLSFCCCFSPPPFDMLVPRDRRRASTFQPPSSAGALAMPEASVCTRYAARSAICQRPARGSRCPSCL